VKAAASMMPSSAMLMAPPSSESSPPSAGRMIGVETRITEAMNATEKMLCKTVSIDIA
jgi:hypothetical protein